MPADLPPTDYAYVVDVRPLDACVVPHCSIKGRSVVGYSRVVELDGDLGAYVRHGKADNEMFFRRSIVLHKGETYAFDVPESSAASELDMNLSAEETGPYNARVHVTAQKTAGAPETVLDTTYRGDTKVFSPRGKNEQCGNIAEFEKHVRIALPSRSGRLLRVTIENTGSGALAVGNPLVMKRVEGRGPRQGFLVVFDAVPFYLFEKLFTGTGDAPTEVFHRMTAERGYYFPQGFSPGVSTQMFVRRFFRNGYFQNEGEPIVRGFEMDEDPPARSPTTIARFAEQGFLTEEFVGNFILNPDVTALGVDGGYQNETISIGSWPTLYHPRALASYFDAWLAEHAHDDAWSVVWMTTTHDSARLKMWGATRPEVKAPIPPTITSEKDFRANDVQARWENLLDSADSVRDIMNSAAKRSPRASRLWFITADHGLIQVGANEHRAARYRDSVLPGGPQHRFFGSTEESWTPFAILYDGVARPPNGPRVIEGRTMAAASWRAFEKLFDVDLGLPDTSAFDSPGLSPGDFENRWWNDGAISLGHAGAVRVGVGKWGYRCRQPKLWLTPLWTQPAQFQRMLGGTDRRSGAYLGEELYDDETDPLETKNVAASHPDVIVAMRRRMQDFHSTWYDAPTHPRHKHVLTFESARDLIVEGPRPFKLRVDGNDVTMTNPRKATVRAKRLEIFEDKDAMGIVSIKGPGVNEPLLLRCAASGQPLDELGPARDRFDLALARHNCATKSDATPPKGEVYFSSEQVRTKASGTTSAGGANKETLEAFRRWGYVRDIDQKH